MALNQDTLNRKLILEWLEKHTKLTENEKNVFLNIKKQIQSDLSLFYEMNRLIVLNKGGFKDKKNNINFECSNDFVTLDSLFGRISMEANEFRKIIGTFIEVYEPTYPLGTVLELKKEAFRGVLNIDEIECFKVIVAHRFVPSTEGRYIPYIGVHYPYGPIEVENDGLFFSPAVVERVLELGYSDEKETAYVFALKSKIIAQMDIHSNVFMSREEYIKITNNNNVTI